MFRSTADEDLGLVYLPVEAPTSDWYGSGSPMTYLVDGRQYIVVAISGGNRSGEYLAFRSQGARR